MVTNTARAQTLASDTIFQWKDPGSLEKRLILGLEQDAYKLSLENLSLPKVRNLRNYFLRPHNDENM
jgi:hypothetical protein